MLRFLRTALIVSTLAGLPLAALQNAAHAAQSGVASEYTDSRTASGEHFNSHALTAASKTLPFGTLVRVTNTRNGRSVVVRINDRGPYVGGRIIDLTPVAARAIGMDGLAHVTVTVL